MAGKVVFLTLDVDTQKTVQNFDSLRKTAKELEAQFKKMNPDDKGWDTLKEKVILAKYEIFRFNEQLRVSPSFTEKLSAAIKKGFADVAIQAQKAEASLRALVSEQQNLALQIAKTNDTGKKNELLDQFKKLEAQIVNTRGELSTLNTTLDKGLNENKNAIQKFSDFISDSFKKIGTAVIAAFAVDRIVEFGKSSVEAYSNQKQAEAQLTAALKGRSDITERLIKEASRLQAAYNIDDDVIVKQQAFLAIAKRSEDQINKTIQAAIQYSAVYSVDLPTAVETLNKTLEGNKGKLAQQNADIEKFTPEQLKAGAAVDYFAQKLKGQAEALANTDVGKVKFIAVQFNDLKESVGQKLVEAIVKLKPIIESVITGFFAFARVLASIPSFVIENRAAFVALGVAIVSFNAASIAASLNTLRLAAAQKIQQVTTFATTVAQQGLNAALKASPIGFIIGLVASLVAGFILLYNNSEKVRGAVSGLWAGIKTAFIGIAQAAKDYIGGVGNLLIGVFTLDKDKITAGLNGLKNAFSGLTNIAGNAGKAAKDAYNSEISKAGEGVTPKGLNANPAAVIADAKRTREIIESELSEVEASIKTVEIGSAAEKQLLDQKKRLQTELDKADGKEAKPDNALKEKLDKELKAVEDHQKALIAKTTEGTAARYEAEVNAANAERDEKLRIAALTIKDKQQLEDERVIINSEANDKIAAADEKNLNRLIQNQKEANQAVLNTTEAGTDERLSRQLEGLQNERTLVLSNKKLTEDQRININAEYDAKEKAVKENHFQELAQIERSHLEARKSNLELQLAQVKGNAEKEKAIKIELERVKAELEQNSSAARLAFLQSQKDANIKLTKEEEDEYLKLLAIKEKATADSNNNISDLNKAAAEKAKEDAKAAADAAIQGSQQILSNISQSIQSNAQARIDAIQSELDTQLASYNTQEKAEIARGANEEATRAKYAAKKEAAQKNAAEKEKEIKRKAFEQEKAISIIQALIAGAVAVVNALKTGPILAAVVGGLAAAQVAFIQGQRPPQFAKGGMITTGADHASGGIKLYDTQSGSVIGEVEGGEPILTKGVSKDPALLAAASAINVAAGGRPLAPSSYAALGAIAYRPQMYYSKFAPGGAVPQPVNVNVENDVTGLNQAVQSLANVLSKPIKAYTLSSDMTNQQNIDATIDRRSSLFNS